MRDLIETGHAVGDEAILTSFRRALPYILYRRVCLCGLRAIMTG